MGALAPAVAAYIYDAVKTAKQHLTQSGFNPAAPWGVQISQKSSAQLVSGYWHYLPFNFDAVRLSHNFLYIAHSCYVSHILLSFVDDVKYQAFAMNPMSTQKVGA